MNTRKKINIIKVYADQNHVVYKETKKGLLIPLEESMTSKRITMKDIMDILVVMQQDIKDMKNTPTMKRELAMNEEFKK